MYLASSDSIHANRICMYLLAIGAVCQPFKTRVRGSTPLLALRMVALAAIAPRSRSRYAGMDPTGRAPRGPVVADAPTLCHQNIQNLHGCRLREPQGWVCRCPPVVPPAVHHILHATPSSSCCPCYLSRLVCTGAIEPTGESHGPRSHAASGRYVVRAPAGPQTVPLDE